MVSRRKFLAGAAGTAVTAGIVAGCSEDVSAALEPWSASPAERDARLRAVAWARLAPSSHNLQPWRVWLDGADGLYLLADPERCHVATDPDLRQVTISQGTFLELLTIAAAADGRRAEITPFPDGPYQTQAEMADRPVAHVRLIEDAATLPPPVFLGVRDRRTTRGAFTGQAVTTAERNALEGAAQAIPGVGVGFVDRGSAMERLRGLIIEAMRTELHDPAACAELATIMRLTPDEVLLRRDGLAPLPFLLGRVVRFLYGDQAFADPASLLTRTGFHSMAKQAETATAFLWLVTAGNTREDQLRAGRAYLRLDLEAVRQEVKLQPLSQPLQEYAAMQDLHREVGALLARPGDTVQMLVRLGHAEAEPPSARRAVRDIVRG